MQSMQLLLRYFWPQEGIELPIDTTTGWPYDAGNMFDYKSAKEESRC